MRGVTKFGGRTFDWRRPKRGEHPKNSLFPVSVLLKARPSPWDHKQDRWIRDLEARVANLEAAVFGPAPAPPPAPPSPPPPGPTPPAPGSAVVWDHGGVIDQGQEGECVGFGCADFLAAHPSPQDIGSVADIDANLESTVPELIYTKAQAAEGETPDEQGGTTVHGGMVAMTQMGKIASYHWAANLAEVAQSILTIGPVVIGIDWYEGMMDVDASGHLHASGTVVGGHCVCLLGYDPKSGDYTGINSWGTSWGNGGLFLINEKELAVPLGNQPELAVALKA